MSSSQKPALIGAGPLAGLGAFVIWGFLGFYFKIIDFASPFEILAHPMVGDPDIDTGFCPETSCAIVGPAVV